MLTRYASAPLQARACTAVAGLQSRALWERLQRASAGCEQARHTLPVLNHTKHRPVPSTCWFDEARSGRTQWRTHGAG